MILNSLPLWLYSLDENHNAFVGDPAAKVTSLSFALHAFVTTSTTFPLNFLFPKETLDFSSLRVSTSRLVRKDEFLRL